MGQPFIGEIRMFGFNFAPAGWAFCDGALLPISQNDTLFALIGTQFGGDGVTTFAIPNLQGRVPFGIGTSSEDEFGVSWGQQGGVAEVTLSLDQFPPHAHTVIGRNAPRTSTSPDGSALVPGDIYAADGSLDGTLAPSIPAGGGGPLPHSNVQPYLALNFCISLFGIFPPRDDVAA